jgi:AcrR family transcriptional regulator
MRAKRLPRKIREQQILDAAVEVFSRNGYHSASMDDIAEAAEISKPMVYAYLGSKDDLFAKCMHREAARLLSSIAEAIDLEAAVDVQMWQGLRAFFHYVQQYQDSWRVLHRYATAQGGPFAAEIEQMRARAIQMVDAMIVQRAAEAANQSVASAALKSNGSLATALVGGAEAVADWWVEHAEESPDTIATRLMNLVWMGFGDLIQDNVWKPPVDL